MALYEYEFESANHRDVVYAWLYTPLEHPRAIVHLVHGLGEHSRRYLPMINSLVDAGVAVVADDHVGHGKTAMISGVWQDTGDSGWHTYVADEHTLAQLARAQFPGIPFIMVGHSWGSMIARAYAARHGQDLDGLILGGLAEQMRGAGALDLTELDTMVATTGGAEPAPLELIATLFGSMTERFEHENNPNAWIASHAPVVDDHGKDPLNNFSAHMSLRFLRDFLAMYESVTAEDYARSLPVKLPVLFLAGDQDPVGNYGEGVYHAANNMWRHGMRDIRTVVFPGLRHEVHNEPESREAVMREIHTFVLRVADAAGREHDRSDAR